MRINYLWYGVLIASLLVSCQGGNECDALLDGKKEDRQELARAFSSIKLRDLAEALQVRLDRGVAWYGQAANTVLLRALVQAMAARPEGTKYAVDIFSTFMKERPLDKATRSILGAVAETNGAALLALIRSLDFRAPPAILPELIAVLASATDEKLYDEFCSLLAGYDVAPKLFEAAFATMPLIRFHTHLDAAKSELKKIALERIRTEWGAARVRPEQHEAVTERVRFFTAAGTPMLAVLFVELMSEAALRPGGLAEEVRRRTVEQLYLLTEGLKVRIEDRSEEEKMLFASIMARLYRAR